MRYLVGRRDILRTRSCPRCRVGVLYQFPPGVHPLPFSSFSFVPAWTCSLPISVFLSIYHNPRSSPPFPSPSPSHSSTILAPRARRDTILGTLANNRPFSIPDPRYATDLYRDSSYLPTERLRISFTPGYAIGALSIRR